LKKYVFLFSAFAISLLASCNLKDFSSTSDSLLFIVPETALFGVYVNDIEGFTDQFAKNEVLEKQVEALLQEQQAGFMYPDSLQVLGLAISELSISWHSISDSEASPLLLAKTQRPIGQEAVSQIISDQLSKGQGKIESKFFNDYEIYQYSSDTNNFFWLTENEMLALSTSEILVEDVVRSMNDENALFTGLGEDRKYEGNKFFLNGKRYTELEHKIIKQQGEFSLKDQVLLLDFEVNQDELVFRGESIGAKLGSTNNQLLFGQSFIPLDAEYFEWQVGESSDSEFISEFYAVVAIEIFENPENLYLLHAAEPAKLKNELEQIERFLLQPEDSAVYREEFASQEIGFISNETFANYIGDDAAYLNDGAFYCIVDDVLLVSPSAELIRISLAAHFDESTYGQSVEKSKFLDELVQDTYFTKVVNLDNVVIDEAYNQAYQALLKKWVDQLSYSVLQVNSTASNSLISGAIGFYNSSEDLVVSDLDDRSLMANAFLGNSAHTKSFVLRNHNTNGREIMVQDVAGILYQVDLEGNINWQKEIDGQVRGEIIQVDYYNNKKLQYLMVTDSLIHIIDRNGSPVNGFPKAHKIDAPINGLSLIDYDNTKRYRYLISAGRGDLYLYDKEGKILEGWSPKSIDAVLKDVPFHQRVGGKDFFVLAERANQVHLLNRRANDYPNFPIDLKHRFSGDLYFKKGPTLAKSEMALISDDGLLSRINLNGQLIEERQFLKNQNADRYELITDVLNRGYVLLRYGQNAVEVLDANGEKLFEIPSRDQDLEVNYYRFSRGRSVLVFWNKATSQVSVYDLAGNLVNDQLRATQEPALLYFSRAGYYQLFTNFNEEIRIHQLLAKD